MLGGLAAEYAIRLLLTRARLRGFDRLVGQSPLRAFGRAILLEVVALVALWGAARLVLGQIGDKQAVSGQLGQQVLLALVHWRVFSLLFRVWLRPEAPTRRIAPVDDTAARRLLLALNLMILLPLSAIASRRRC